MWSRGENGAAWGDDELGWTELDAVLRSIGEASPLRESCAYVVSVPGRRFRASLVREAAGYGDHPDDPRVAQVAVAIELFHAATLAHDDVVDDGKLRRGRPAIGAQAGNLTASLAGGWLCARASELIAGVGSEAAAAFAETAAAVCDGEMMEMGDLYDVDRTRERYFAVIAAKTASLFAFSAWVGASAGGADPAVAAALRGYGTALGMAFQISDDLLDLLASPERTGKTPGSDLRQGVYTLPVIEALRAEPGLRDELLRDPDPRELPGLVERVQATGAVALAAAECTDWIERACADLPVQRVGASSRHLYSLAESVGERVREPAAA